MIAPAKTNKRPKKEAKLYLALSIGPIITKLVNRIAVTRPKKVMAFMCDELKTMIYGGDEEERGEVEADERFAMYKGMDGPREVTEEVVEVQVENPPAQYSELDEVVPEVSTGEPRELWQMMRDSLPPWRSLSMLSLSLFNSRCWAWMDLENLLLLTCYRDRAT